MPGHHLFHHSLVFMLHSSTSDSSRNQKACDRQEVMEDVHCADPQCTIACSDVLCFVQTLPFPRDFLIYIAINTHSFIYILCV